MNQPQHDYYIQQLHLLKSGDNTMKIPRASFYSKPSFYFLPVIYALKPKGNSVTQWCCKWAAPLDIPIIAV